MDEQTSNRRLSRASSIRRLLPHVARRRQSLIASSQGLTQPPVASLQEQTSPSARISTADETLLRRGSRSILGVTSANYLPRESKKVASAHPHWEVRIDTPGKNYPSPTDATGKSSPRSWDFRKQFGHSGLRKPEGSVLRKMRTPNLGINVSREPGRGNSPLNSPRTPHTPHSPFAQSFTEGQGGNDVHQTSSPVIPREPSPNPAKKSFFSNKNASRSTTKLPKSGSPVKNLVNASPKPGSSMATVYNMNKAMGSSPELTVSHASGTVFTDPNAYHENAPQTHNDAYMHAPHQAKKKPSKHKFTLLGRKGSVKDEESQMAENMGVQRLNKGLRETGPDRVVKGSALRNHSADGLAHDETRSHAANGKDNNNSSHGIRHTGTRAADGLGRAAKGIFGKLSNRSAGPTDSSRENNDRSGKAERDAAEAQKAFMTKTYAIIHEPLEVQARATRICKRLEECKDKTEFWLPALAYRCIDYLNDKGMAHEGLYRVPGSEREIRNWIWRFDQEHDIDLLSEEELYDINTISSMFKAWLRDLPDEVFPKSIQHKISATVPNLNEQPNAPEMLKTELSQLPPFNYYLLFAVTAHITMLLNASKENKMTFHNLCVCFMPALKMELPCFQWLILDWKNCWQGCSTEKDYLLREYALEKENAEEGDGTAIPEQHFDRYPPVHSRSFDSNQSGTSRDRAPVMSNSLPSENRIDNARPSNTSERQQLPPRNQPERQTGSPIKTKSIDPPVPMPSLQPSNSRRGKKPMPLESTLLGSVRRDSDASVQTAKNQKDDTREAKNTSRAESRNGHVKDDIAAPDAKKKANNGGSLLPELAPVQPLSPFGALDSFSR